MEEPIKISIFYSKKDERYKELLFNELSSLNQISCINHKTSLQISHNEAKTIYNNLIESNIVYLLITPHFTSDFFYYWRNILNLIDYNKPIIPIICQKDYPPFFDKSSYPIFFLTNNSLYKQNGVIISYSNFISESLMPIISTPESKDSGWYYIGGNCCKIDESAKAKKEKEKATIKLIQKCINNLSISDAELSIEIGFSFFKIGCKMTFKEKNQKEDE